MHTKKFTIIHWPPLAHDSRKGGRSTLQISFIQRVGNLCNMTRVEWIEEQVPCRVRLDEQI